MSVWHQFNGTVIVHKDKHVSIKKSFEVFYKDDCEAQLVISNKTEVRGRLIYEVQGMAEGSGLEATNRFNSFLSAIKERDKNASIDISLTVRFF